ncbi:MAG: SpoIIE family protein phosphatase [Actinomycetota bacterium]|nr:SpoIIE family protein phosphatase [Actinomycetota bacterium]
MTGYVESVGGDAEQAGVGEDVVAGLPVPDFAKVFDEAPTPFLLLTPDFVIVHANRARLEATATTLEGTVGRNLFDVFPLNPDDPAADGIRNLAASLARARDTRRPVTMAIQKYDIPMPDGGFEERYWSPRNVPILDDEGRVVLLLHRSDDITDYIRDRDTARREAASGAQWRERAERVEADLFDRARELESLNAELRRTSERERRTARWLAGLASTVSALAAAETLDEVFARLSTHARPAVGAGGVVVGLRSGEELHLVLADAAGGHPLPGVEVLPLDSPRPIAVAARGERVLAHDRPELDAYGPAPDYPLGDLQAWAALPLRVGGELLGALTLGWGEPQPLDDDTVGILDALAVQCAQAVDRVRRLQAERERATATRSLAETLQRALLTEPPQPDHLQVAVRYRPAAREAEVGGDWYDAFLTPSGTTTLVIGDVTGHDRTAAAVMGQLRNLLRGVAHALDAPPAQVLTALDQAIRDLGVTSLATVVLARVEQTPAEAAAGLRTLRWSNAGHLPPLLVEPDGTACVLERPADLLLGLLPDIDRGDHTVTLQPGATVLLYTDGLVERRGEALDAGLARLVEAAGELRHLAPDDLCDALLARLAPEPGDDIALVALRAHPEDAPRPDGVGADDRSAATSR